MAVDQTELNRPPDPDDPRKPESPTDLTKPSLLYVLRKTAREFQQDECTDLAAAFTYYAVLSLFPALLVLVSLLGVFGQGRETVDAVMQIAAGVVPSDAMNLLRQPVEHLVQSPSAGVALITGALAALWSASGYVGAFGLYVANFSSYNKTYGSLAGVIVFLLWLWITNLALLFGAELDAELERGRQLQAGLPAEREIQLPPRDTRVLDKNKKAEEKDIKRAEELRRTKGAEG